MRQLTLALISLFLAVLFNGPLTGVTPALADPTLSGAEPVQVANSDFSGAGLGEVGTPPANYDFETPSATVGTPPTNHNFSTGDFTGWTLTGSPTIQSGGPGGFYARLVTGQKIKSSAFTVHAQAQALIVNVSAVSTGTFQWKFNIYSGVDYSTLTVKAITTCPTTCTTWSAYPIDIVPWAGQSIKVEMERYLGDLNTDDVAVGQEVLVYWSPVAGDKVTRETGGPTGAYAKTTTAITSAAFTLDANAQNGLIDTKIDSASGSYGVHVLSGVGYGTSTQVYTGTQTSESVWATRTFGIGDWAGQSIKLKVVPAVNTTVLVDRAGIAKNEVPGWTTSGTSPVIINTQSGPNYLSSYTTLKSRPMTLDYLGYYGNTRVNWFRIIFVMTENLSCPGTPIGSLMNVYFGDSVSPFYGYASYTAEAVDAYFYIYNPTSPFTPIPQTGTLEITGWPSPPALYSCENARNWKPPAVASIERVDAPPVTDCSTGGVMAADLSSKPVGGAASGVDVVSGNYFRGNTDLSIPGVGVPLRFTRCYSAWAKFGGLADTGPLGNKWSHNWQASLTEFDSGNHAQVKLPGGGSLVFAKIAGSFVPPGGFEGNLVRNVDGTWTLTTKHKLVYTFDPNGKLTSVKDRNLNAVSLSYDGSARLSTITALGARSLTLTYNADNRISTVADSAARSVSYGYNATTGDLTSVTNVLTGTTSYQYAGHLLTQVADPNNHLSARNTYDTNRRVTQQLDALGAVATFSYATPGKGATRVTDPKNYQTTQYFDTSMRITDVMDHNSGVTTTIYDSDNNPTSVTNALLKTWQYTYDATGNVVTARDPLLNTWIYTYTATNDVDSEVDPLNRVNDYVHDSIGNLTRLARKESGIVKALTCYELDSAGQVTAIVQSTDLVVPPGPTDPCTGNKTLFGYDAAGNQTCVVNARYSSSTTCATDPASKSTFIYDLAGRAIYATSELTNYSRPVRGTAPETGTAQCGTSGMGNGVNDDSPDDSVIDDGCPSVTSTYDALGDELTSKDALGYTTSNSYDLKGLLIKATNADRQPNAAAETGTQCGANGTGNDADDDSDGVKDDGCPSAIYSYDNADRLVEVIDPIGGETSYSYDAAGNNTSITSPRAPIRPVGANGPETPAQCGSTGFGNGVNEDAAADDTVVDDGCPSMIYAYDSLHRLQSITDALGRVTTHQYDAASRLQQLTDARGLVTKYFPDIANRPDYIEHWNGAFLVDTIDFTLDAAGRRAQLSDPTGVTTFGFDALDRVTSITYPGPKTVSYQYDSPGGGGGPSAAYPGQRTKITYPDSKNVIYTYDVAGNMKTVTDWLGKRASYVYDNASGVQRLPLDEVVSSTNLTGATVANLDDDPDAPDAAWATATTVADTSLRVGFPTPPGGPIVGAGLQEFRVQLRKNAAGGNNPTYDIQLWETGGSAPLATLASAVSLSSDTGTVVSTTWDAALLGTPNGTAVELVIVGHLSGGSPSNRRTVEVGAVEWNADYDAPPTSGTGQLTRTQLPNGVSTAYTYDAAERLTAVTNKKGASTISSFAYTLDKVGNRTQMVDLSGTHTYVYDPLQRLTQVTYPGPQTDTYTYDANGNRLTKNATTYTYDAAEQMTTAGGTSYGYDNNGNRTSRGSDTFTYDHDNRLTQAVMAGATSSSVYNGDGLRTSHTVGGLTTGYAWDAASGLPLVLQDGTNTNVYGLDLTSVTDGAGVQTYNVYDGLGSTAGLTDGAGNNPVTYSYDVFGAIRSQTGTSPNYWLFTGEQRDVQGGTPGGTQRLPLDQVVSSTNLTGATVANLDDDPDAPDAAWATATTVADTSLRTGFPTPTSGNPTQGPGLQEFRVQLRKNASAGNNPTYDIQLWETGGSAPLATLASGVTLSSDTGTVVSATWDASLLGTPNGSAVELVIVGHRSGGPASKQRTVEVGAVEWNVNYQGTPPAELYYLRARYYDPAIGRFLNLDPLGEGNGYSYAFNNPVNLVDPSGLSVWEILGIDSGSALTAVRMGLSVTPVIGDVNDAIAIVTGYDIIWGERISMEERGFYAAGLLFGSGGAYRHGLGLADDAAHGASLARKIHGNSHDSTKLTRLYRINDASGGFRKWGTTSEYPITRRYSKSYLAEREMVDTGTIGSRREIAAIERWFEEYLPGPDNKTLWSGRHKWDFPSLFGQ